MKRIAILLAAASTLFAADPTFLRRHIPDVAPLPDDLTAGAKGSSYRPAFGVGDSQAKQLKGIARYGELTVAADGATAVVSYPAEEQIYYIVEGTATLLYEDEKAPVKKDDFMYLPPGVKHGIANASNLPVRLLVMGFKIPPGTKLAPTPKLMLANAADVGLVPVQGHGPTSLFKLL